MLDWCDSNTNTLGTIGVCLSILAPSNSSGNSCFLLMFLCLEFIEAFGMLSLKLDMICFAVKQ